MARLKRNLGAYVILDPYIEVPIMDIRLENGNLMVEAFINDPHPTTLEEAMREIQILDPSRIVVFTAVAKLGWVVINGSLTILQPVTVTHQPSTYELMEPEVLNADYVEEYT